MGIADIMPGVSGSTVAMVFGFYPELIDAIKSFRIRQFLLPLLLGIALAILTMSRVIHTLLSHPQMSQVLYGIFFILVLFSAILCLRSLNFRCLPYVFVGLGVGYLLTLVSIPAGVLLVSGGWFQPWMIFCGLCATCALLLPGISGSYMLLLLGVYPSIIAALVEFTSGDLTSLPLLLNVLIGIGLGGVFFSRFISWLLRDYNVQALAFLGGMIIGALPLFWK